jgi:hypothetical protein
MGMPERMSSLSSLLRGDRAGSKTLSTHGQASTEFCSVSRSAASPPCLFGADLGIFVGSFATGVIASLAGVGGGILVVPALTSFPAWSGSAQAHSRPSRWDGAIRLPMTGSSLDRRSAPASCPGLRAGKSGSQAIGRFPAHRGFRTILAGRKEVAT